MKDPQMRKRMAIENERAEALKRASEGKGRIMGMLLNPVEDRAKRLEGEFEAAVENGKALHGYGSASFAKEGE